VGNVQRIVEGSEKGGKSEKGIERQLAGGSGQQRDDCESRIWKLS
jgi:hypothetical protein